MSEPTLSQVDPDISALLRLGGQRQHDKVRLLPSGTYASRAVMEASDKFPVPGIGPNPST